MITARNYRMNYSIISLPCLPPKSSKTALCYEACIHTMLKKKGDRRPPVVT